MESAAPPYNAWPRSYKTFFTLNSTEHEIFLLINVNIHTDVGMSTFMSGENSILGLSEPKKPNLLIFSYLRAFKISCSTELSMKKFYNLGA